MAIQALSFLHWILSPWLSTNKGSLFTQQVALQHSELSFLFQSFYLESHCPSIYEVLTDFLNHTLRLNILYSHRYAFLNNKCMYIVYFPKLPSSRTNSFIHRFLFQYIITWLFIESNGRWKIKILNWEIFKKNQLKLVLGAGYFLWRI